jgi:acetyltransferase-like isoleucine patch superfamily enzyme
MNYPKRLAILLLWNTLYYLSYPWEFTRRLLLGLKVEQAGRNITYQIGFDVFGGTRVHIGDNVALFDVFINCVDAEVHIGKDCFFGHRTMVLTGSHNYHAFGLERQKQVDGKSIYIEEGVWIGSGAIILGGVIIGKHSVIAAGSVVSKDIPPYSIAAGVPARVIRTIETN